MGPSGSGHLAKLDQQHDRRDQHRRRLREALAFAAANELDLATLTRVISTGAARCWPLEKIAQYYNEPLPPGWQEPRGGGRGSGQPGQLTWAIRMAVELGVALPITALAHELVKLAGLPEPPAAQAMMRTVFAAEQQFPERPSAGGDASG